MLFIQRVIDEGRGEEWPQIGGERTNALHIKIYLYIKTVKSQKVKLCGKPPKNREV